MNEMHAGKIDGTQLANKCNHVNICLPLPFAESAIFGASIIIHIRKTPREKEGGGAISLKKQIFWKKERGIISSRSKGCARITEYVKNPTYQQKVVSLL